MSRSLRAFGFGQKVALCAYRQQKGRAAVFLKINIYFLALVNPAASSSYQLKYMLRGMEKGLSVRDNMTVRQFHERSPAPAPNEFVSVGSDRNV